MSKETSEHVEPMETRRRAKKVSCSKDMISSFENRVGNLEESVGDMKETLELVMSRIEDLREDSKEFLWDTLRSTSNKLTVRDDVLEALVTAMKGEIAELKGDLTIYKVAMESGMMASRSKHTMWMFQNPRTLRELSPREKWITYSMGIEDDATKRRCKATDEKHGGTTIETWEEL
ncbi:hypothetical protein PVK06_035366 [Gossypium arboreum]|uniref:Uncharacterized protein n=1 Tax=Gossypium arboreum TaxID=29729 RepID=A0ABR0NH64_GOSAR|nr:hypothetical protein PVK06_035366 [Gossypium arboreum]